MDPFALDRMQMLPQPRKHLLAFGVFEFADQFFQSEVDDVVVVDLFRRDVVAHLQPNAVQQVNLFRREMRRVRAEVRDMLLARGKIENER